MKKEYLYLDWNVFQYLKSPRTSTMDEALIPIVARLSKRYWIPYSEAHLRDLASGFSEETKNHVEEDLDFISRTTGSHALILATPNTQEPLEPTRDREEIMVLPRDCRADFKKILEAIKIEENASVPVAAIHGAEKYAIDVASLGPNDLFLAALKANAGNLDATVMQQVIDTLWEQRDDPSFYKRFREEAKKIVDYYEKRTATVLDKESTVYTELRPFFKYASTTNQAELKQQFIPALRAFAHVSGRAFDDLTIGGKIELAYGLLDFHPNFSEPVNKKKRPSNQLRDCKHLFWASDAKFLVSQDKRFLDKAQLVTSSLGLRVKVIDISAFISRFS